MIVAESIACMSRNFPMRTAVTGVRLCGGPLYGIAGAVCGAPGGRSAGYLSVLTAPAGRDCDSIPTLDASRVSQRDERIVCVLLSGCAPAKANNVSIPAVRNRRNAARTRKFKKAAGRGFFIFIAKDLRDESQTGHLPATRDAKCRSLSDNYPVASFLARTSELLFLQGAYARQRFSAYRCRQSSSPWSPAQRRHQPRNASGQSAEVRLLSR